MKKTIKDFNLLNKKVLIRVDFNVPLKAKKILDDTRIKSSLKTINYAIEKGAKVILLSHLGRIKTLEDLENNSLKIVQERLSELLNKEVLFSNKTRGEELETTINNLKSSEVLLIENTRFEDYPNNLESNNDLELAKYWASLGDVFINDAFGTSHRNHASNKGLSKLLPSGIGFLIEKEFKIINNVLKEPEKPFTVILGGSKVHDKIKVIENLVNIADNILIGGAMAFTFLKAEGFEVGQSIVDNNSLVFCKKILAKYGFKIVLPIDVVCAAEASEEVPLITKKINEITEDEIGLDIGSETISLFSNYIKESKTIIWNGPLGFYEIEKFSLGTKEIAKFIASSNLTSIIGGGDTASAIINMELDKEFTHISTGGGATLKLLEGSKL